MSDVLEVEKVENDKAEKAEKARLDKLEKAKVERAKKAKGPIFGGLLTAKSDSKVTPKTDLSPEQHHALTAISEVYDDGYHFLVVKCTRGEQKAMPGDVAYQITLTDEATLEETVYLFLVPGECVEHLKDLVPPPPEGGMTTQEYSEFQKKEAERRIKISNELPGTPRARPGTPSQLPSPPKATPRTAQ